jgi:surfactin synthase thioesterase subunit
MTWPGPAVAPNRWIAVPGRRPRARVRLFCFPYAGGTASIFHSWPARLPAAVEVCAIQLPGRANRLGETSFVRLPALVSALEDALLPALDRPFAFFGHSMGALVAFELACRLRTARRLEPWILFVSAARAPQLTPRRPPGPAPREKDLRRALRRLDGTPAEVMASAELMALVAPAVKADIALCESYVYRRRSKLTCPISVFGGRRDRSVSRAGLAAWAAATRGRTAVHMLPGGHTFMNGEEDRLVSLIAADLSRIDPSWGTAG